MRMAGSSARSGVPFAIAVWIAAAVSSAQTPESVEDVLARVGTRVAENYNHAQRIVCQEKFTMQPIRHDFTFEGFGRVLEYELRVDWDPNGNDDGGSPEPTVLRELRKVNGRTPKPKDEPACTDPKPSSPEPLAFLLPARRGQNAFTLAGIVRLKDQIAIAVDYRSLERGRPEVTRNDECFSFSLPGRTKGRVWVDPETYDVLRVDEHLTARVDYRLPLKMRRFGDPEDMVVERYDTSIRYRRITFHDPDETVLLPETIESVVLFRGAQSHRTTQVFSDFRRFTTAGRLVKEH
jgi:hypothetical protein